MKTAPLTGTLEYGKSTLPQSSNYSYGRFYEEHYQWANVWPPKTSPPPSTVREATPPNLLLIFFFTAVWKLAPFSTSVNTRGLVNLPGCWNSLCRLVCLPPSGITAGPLAPWILWHLWLARNDYVFNNKETTAEMIITKAVASAREWLSAQTPDSPAKPSTQRVPDSNRTPYSTLLQTDAAWREGLQDSAGLWEKDLRRYRS